MHPIILTIEKSKNKLWGRIFYESNLIVDVARTPHQLEKRMKRLLKDLHKVEPGETVFNIRYDGRPKRIFQHKRRGERLLY